MYPIKQSTSTPIMIFAHDANGDAVTGKVDGDWTKRISKNGGAFGAMTVTITEAENGWYSLTLSTSHTDTLGILSLTFTATGVKQINIQYRVQALLEDDNVVVGSIAANAINAAAIANGAIDAATFAAGAIDAAAIANNAIDYATFAADVYKLFFGAVLSGTAESGSTTTLVDSTQLDQADADYWKGDYVLFTSGNIGGQCRLITGFNAATDTITFTPAVTQAVSNQEYSIIPAARVDLQLWLGSVANALVSGRVDSSVGAVASDALTAAALAADAVNEIRDSILSDSTPFAGGNINASISSRATPAQVNSEVLDVLTVDTFAEAGAVPSATSTLKDKLNWLFALARNKITQTATVQTLRNDADSGSIATSSVSDDGTTATRAEWT